MAFQTATSTSIDNLMAQLNTFLVANGWVQDHFTAGDPGRAGWHKNGMFVAFQWTDATDGGVLAIYQNKSNDDTVDVWLSTGDDGLGENSTTAASFDTGRHVSQFAGPHTAYWFFEQDSAPAYVHVVVEVDAGRFRHFGFGEIEKVGDWIGGDYIYGHFWDQNTSRIDDPDSGFHAFGPDNGTFNTTFAATMSIEGFPEQGVSDEWGRFGQGGNFPAGQDRAGNDRMPLLGSFRGGMAYAAFNMFRLSVLSAFKPMAPLVYLVRDTGPAPDVMRILGTHPDIRGINIGNIDPGETFTVAGETWFAFPWVRKQFLSNDTEESWNGGLAYRQETA
ncbi:MAG: hypothetical protein V3W32_11440 [Gemmatimonadota bacterium]